MKKGMLAAALSLLAAAALFIINMNAFSLWLDEYYVVLGSQDLAFGVGTGHPPLYFLLLRGWSLVAGSSDFVLRALSAFFAILTAALIYRIALDISGEPFAGAAAVLLFSSMGFVRYYVHQVHNYTLLTLVVASLILVYWRWWHASTRLARRRWGVAILLVSLIAVYTHYYTAFFLVGLNLWALFAARRQPKRAAHWLLLQAGAAVLYLPWLPQIFRLREQPLLVSGASGVKTIPTGQPTSFVTLAETLQTMLADVWWVYGLLAVLGGVAFYRQRRHLPELAMLLTLIVLSLASAFAVNTVFVTFLHRRVIFILIPLALMLALLLSQHASRPLRWSAVLLTMSVALISGRPQDLPGNWYFRQAAQAVEPAPHDLVFFQFGDRFTAPVLLYYAERFYPPTVQAFSYQGRDFNSPAARDQFVETDLLDFLWPRGRFWVVHSAEPGLDYPTELAWAQRIAGKPFEPQPTQTVGWLGVTLFTERETGCMPSGEGVPFGEVLTLHEAIFPTQAGPAEVLPIALTWRADAAPPADYALSLQLHGDQPGPVAQVDGLPRHKGREVFPTLWQPGYTLCGTYELTLPPDLPGGSYDLLLIVYDPASSERLLTPEGDAHRLGVLTVTP